jgi:hypothetical protein
LKYDKSVLAECGFGTGKIKIPHPAEIFPKPVFDHFPIGMQALPPGGERRRIVLAPHFDIGDEEPLLFHNAHHFRQRRRMGYKVQTHEFSPVSLPQWGPAVRQVRTLVGHLL